MQVKIADIKKVKQLVLKNNIKEFEIHWCRGTMFPYFFTTLLNDNYFIADDANRVFSLWHDLYYHPKRIIVKNIIQTRYSNISEFVEYLAKCNVLVKLYRYDVKYRYDMKSDALEIGVGPSPFIHKDKRFSIVTPLYRIMLSQDEADELREYLHSFRDDIIINNIKSYSVLFYTNYAVFYRNDIDNVAQTYAEIVKSAIESDTKRLTTDDIINDLKKLNEFVKRLENIKNPEVEKIRKFVNTVNSVVPVNT